MSLNELMQTYKEKEYKKMPNSDVEVIENSKKTLRESDITKKCLKAGDFIPKFKLNNSEGEEISVEQLLEEGPIVISFFRGEWSPYCTLEIKALQEVLPSIKNENATLIAISPQTQNKTKEMVDNNNITFNVLSDPANKIAKKFGIVYKMSEELASLYKKMGINIPDYTGRDRYELPIPATYVVDTDGKIIYAYIEPDYTSRLEPQSILNVLESTKFSFY